LMTVDEFNKGGISLRPLSEPDNNGERVELGGSLPRGLVAPSPRVVDNNVGYIPIPITVTDRVFVFNIWLRNFVVQKDKGSVAIELQAQPRGRNDPWPLLDRQTAEKVVPEPRITSFTAVPYNVVRGDSVELTWTIEPAGNFEL